MITDTDRINFLQSLLDQKPYTGKCILRDSQTGRGFRLHETSRGYAFSTVREAIDNYMNQYNKLKET